MFRGLAFVMLAMMAGAPALAQTPPVPPPATVGQDPGPTALEDVLVTGDQLEALALEFVESVAAPARRRGLARWESPVCLGVVNFRADAAHQLIDHISDVARDIGVELDEPGCEPNVLIVGTDDGQALASALVARHRSELRFGYTRSNRGSRALETFRTSDASIRWWHISLPYNTETGGVAIRLPGGPAADVPQSGRCLQRRGGMTYCDAVTDRLIRSVIIVDVVALPEISFGQLGDYLSVLALAQVEPETDYAGLDTVLNVLKDPSGVAGLTDWDRSYLHALYSGESERIDPEEQARALADRMRQSQAD